MAIGRRLKSHKSRDRTEAAVSPGLRDPPQSVTTIVIISGCVLSATASCVGILLLFVVKRRKGVCGRRRSHFLVAASASQDNTEEQDGVLNEAGAISHAVASCSSGTELLEPTSSARRADGLIYGELEFSDRTSSNVIIGSLPNTQYAQINFTNSV